MKTIYGCEEADQKLVLSDRFIKDRFIKDKFKKINRDISFECLVSK